MSEKTIGDRMDLHSSSSLNKNVPFMLYVDRYLVCLEYATTHGNG
jgi:hypothetical protein